MEATLHHVFSHGLVTPAGQTAPERRAGLAELGTGRRGSRLPRLEHKPRTRRAAEGTS